MKMPQLNNGLWRAGLAVLLLGTSGLLLGSTSSCDPPNSPSFYGVNTSYFPITASQANLDLAAANGFRWARINFEWASMNPSDNVYNFADADAAVSRAQNAGFSILVTFREVPEWARGTPNSSECAQFSNPPDGGDTPPASPEPFRKFTEVVARRYGLNGLVRAWELWNEPDHCAFFNGTAAQFREMILVPGSAGIRASGAAATIVAPGLGLGGSGGVRTLLDRYLTIDGAGNHLAAPVNNFSFHTYGSVADVKAIMDNADPWQACTPDGGTCALFYWVTEFGFDDAPVQTCHICFWGGVTQGVGNAAVDIYSYCRGAQTFCHKAFYWSLINQVDPPTGPNCNCDPALLDSNGSPRQRLTALGNYMNANP